MVGRFLVRVALELLPGRLPACLGMTRLCPSQARPFQAAAVCCVMAIEACRVETTFQAWADSMAMFPLFAHAAAPAMIALLSTALPSDDPHIVWKLSAVRN